MFGLDINTRTKQEATIQTDTKKVRDRRTLCSPVGSVWYEATGEESMIPRAVTAG